MGEGAPGFCFEPSFLPPPPPPSAKNVSLLVSPHPEGLPTLTPTGQVSRFSFSTSSDLRLHSWGWMDGMGGRCEVTPGPTSVSSSSPSSFSLGTAAPNQSCTYPSQQTIPNQPPPSPMPQGKPTVSCTSETKTLLGSLYVQGPSFWTSLSSSVSWVQRLCGAGYVRQGSQGVGKAGPFLFSSKDESGLWRPEPPVCPPKAPETLFTTGTNSGPEEMAWPWKFHLLYALCS